LVPEEDLIELSEQQAFEIMPCTLCGSQQSQRKFVKGLLSTLEAENPHLKGNLLHALGNVQPSQLMDPKINPLLGKLTSSISAGEVAAQAAIGDDDDTIVVRRKEPQPTSLSILS
jgi:tRNA(Ile)-lysidine synthase TilS/MesJ